MKKFLTYSLFPITCSLALCASAITATKEYVDRQDKKKLDLPAVTIPTNFVPVTIGEGRVAWKQSPGGGGGGGSLGKVTQLQDESGKWHNVSSEWNTVTLQYDLVIDPAEAPHEEMTVQQEMERAVGAETMLLETNTWETAQRIAADEYLESLYESLSTLGRLVSTYDTSTGKPTTEPKDDIFVYKPGDYYIVGKVAEGAYPTNFIPHGAVYYKGSTSTTVAPDEVYVNDVYRYTSDGTWVHVTMKGAPIPWTQIAGNPLDNTNFVIGVHHVTTQTVTKAYVEGLGIEAGISTQTATNIVYSIVTPTDTVFSNAVLSVGLNIDTNSVAVLNEIAATFGGFPIAGTATTVGGLLAALAAAIAWLRKNKVDKSQSGTGEGELPTLNAKEEVTEYELIELVRKIRAKMVKE